MKDKIIQITTATDGEMPGGIGSSIYALGESGTVYYEYRGEWRIYRESPEITDRKDGETK